MYRLALRQTPPFIPVCLLLAGLMSLAGCGTASTQSANVRFVNAVPNGGTASFYVNGNFLGNENFFSQSSYSAVTTGTDTFSFTLGNYAGTTYSTVSSAVSAGASYTAVIMGRPDEASTSTEYPQVQLVADDNVAPPSGDIRLRIFMVAPDLTNVNVNVAAGILPSTTEASDVSYPYLGTSLNIVSGNLTIQAVNAATDAADTPAVTFTGIVAGHHYTAFVVETAITPTYNIELIDDTTNTLLTS